MATPFDAIAEALGEAIRQAAEDAAKLPGPKGCLLEQQAARWRRVLVAARKGSAEVADPERPALPVSGNAGC